MAKRLLKDKLIKRSNINEEIKLIDGSVTDYITRTGRVFKDYGNDMFIEKKTHISSSCGYTYCGITYPEGNKQRRVHILVAKAYIPNPDNKPYVGHKNNIKSCTDVNQLYWTDAQENTKRAFDDGLAHNDKGFEDSQSYYIDVFEITETGLEYIETCGSVHEAARIYKNSISTILRHCRDEVGSYRGKYTYRFSDI